MIFPAGAQIIPNPNAGVDSATQGLGSTSKKVQAPGQGFAQALAAQPSQANTNAPKGLSNQVIGSSKALSLLFRKLDNIDPENIPGILSSNGFLKESLAGDVATVLEQKLTLAEISEKLGIDPNILPESLTGKLAGQQLKLKDFLKKVGIDPHAISAELERLRQQVTQHGLASLAPGRPGGSLDTDQTIQNPSRRTLRQNPINTPHPATHTNQTSEAADQRPQLRRKLTKVNGIDQPKAAEHQQGMIGNLKGRGKDHLKEISQHLPTQDAGDRSNRVGSSNKTVDQNQTAQAQEAFESQLTHQLRDLASKAIDQKPRGTTTQNQKLMDSSLANQDAVSKLDLANPILERIANAGQKLDGIPSELAGTQSKILSNQIPGAGGDGQSSAEQAMSAALGSISQPTIIQANKQGPNFDQKTGLSSLNTQQAQRYNSQMLSRMLSTKPSATEQVMGTQPFEIENSESGELATDIQAVVGKSREMPIHMTAEANSQKTSVQQTRQRPTDSTKLRVTNSSATADISVDPEIAEHFEAEAGPDITKQSAEFRTQLADLAKKATDMLQGGESKATVNLEDMVIDLVLNNETNVVDVTASSEVVSSLQALQSEASLLQSVLKEEGFELGSFETTSENLQNQEFQRNENQAENQKIPFQIGKAQLSAPPTRIPSPFAIPLSGGSSVQLRV